MDGPRRASACRSGPSSPTLKKRPGPRPKKFWPAQRRFRTRPADEHATAGARRLLALAEQGTRIDKRLWTEIAKLTGANSNTTALVGTPEQVAEVFGDYYDLGVSHFLIRGFDPLIDAIEYGRELIPLTRKLIAGRGIARGVAAE